MSTINHATPPPKSVPLSGFLALLCGGGLLYSYLKFAELFKTWSDVSRIGLFAVACWMGLWGLKQVFVGLWPEVRRRRPRGLSRHRVMLPREGATYLMIMAALFVGSLLGRSNTLMLVFAMMPGPFFLNGWIVFSMLKRTQIRRRGPQRVMAGEAASMEIELENRKRWQSSRLMAVRDELEHPREQLHAGVLFARVAPKSTASAHYRIRLMRRGRYKFGRVYLSSRFPLGLVERGLLFDVPGEILVFPRIGRLTPLWKRELQRATELAQHRPPRRGAFDDEFHRLREYRPGDSSQSIHWRTSARRNELMVREYHQNRDQHLTVLIDLWLPPHPVAADLERVELAVSFAATVCLTHLRENLDSNLSIEASGAGVTGWQGSAGPAALESMLDMFAVLQAGPSDEIGRVLKRCRDQRTAATRVVLVTTRRRVNGAFPDLDETDADGRPLTAGGHWQVVEADYRELAPYFQLD